MSAVVSFAGAAALGGRNDNKQAMGDEMMSKSALLGLFAAAGAFLLLAPAPAEAARCPAGYYQCIGGGKAHSPKRCCPIAAPKPKPTGTLTPPRPGARCLSAVRQPGPGGSVKIACVRWGSLTPRQRTCGA